MSCAQILQPLPQSATPVEWNGSPETVGGIGQHSPLAPAVHSPIPPLGQNAPEFSAPEPVIDPGYFGSNKIGPMSGNIPSADGGSGPPNWMMGKGNFWSQAAVVEEETNHPNGYLDIITVESFYSAAVRPYRNYRSSEHLIMTIPTSNQEFGWASLVGTPYLKQDRSQGPSLGISTHFISGPVQINLYPRLYEIVFGYQVRHTINDVFSFDCAATVGFYSDFKGSAREGLRLPGHAVGIIHLTHRTDFVFGADYLDRDDIKILPVVGISWHDYNHMSLRYDLVFPRPRIEYTLNDHMRYYLMALLGGGTWDVELVDGPEDVMTYRDYRVVVGREKRYLDGTRRGVEVGYAFGRQLTLREMPVQIDFRNAFVINFQSTF